MGKLIHIQIYIQIDIHIFKLIFKIQIICIGLANLIRMKKLNFVKIIKFISVYSKKDRLKIGLGKKVY